ncbi:hypothetical protein PENTCL1PPCAC_28949, partial [Pristionchus entomophagus]
QLALVGGGVLIIAIIFYFALVRRENQPMTLLAASGTCHQLWLRGFDKQQIGIHSNVFLQATSTISALGHTIAKFYVVISRYIVLRSLNLSDNWKRSWIVAMLVAQLVIPIIAASPLAFTQPTGIGNGYGPSYLINIVQSISAFIYGAYVITGFILTLLAMRKLRKLLSVASERRKLTAARQEVLITVYSACLFLSHSLKCIQQVIFAVAPGGSDWNSTASKLYPFINDFAVFSSPVLMLIISKQLRRLICSFFHPASWNKQATVT